jgi:hypothetical protein
MPNTRYRIQIFSTYAPHARCVPVTGTIQPGFEPASTCASAGGGLSFLAAQGESLIQELDVVTGADGVAQFSVSVPLERMVTATATALSADGRPLATSEFSQAVQAGRQ